MAAASVSASAALVLAQKNAIRKSVGATLRALSAEEIKEQCKCGELISDLLLACPLSEIPLGSLMACIYITKLL